MFARIMLDLYDHIISRTIILELNENASLKIITI